MAEVCGGDEMKSTIRGCICTMDLISVFPRFNGKIITGVAAELRKKSLLTTSYPVVLVRVLINRFVTGGLVLMESQYTPSNDVQTKRFHPLISSSQQQPMLHSYQRHRK